MIVTNSIGNIDARQSNINKNVEMNFLNWRKRSIFDSIEFISLAAFASWLLIGVLWYMYYHDWTLGTAYYYALEAGLSIGFCEPVEKDDVSKLFTIMYVLVGSSVIAGAVGAVTTSIFYSRIKLKPIEYTSGYLSMKDLTTNTYTFESVTNYYWFEFKLAIGWYHNRTRVCILLVFVFWMCLGTAYGMTFENWTFITSLYWAITSTSTGGLESAKCLPGTEGTTCDIGMVRGGLMGTFFAIGVPVYAFAMAQFSCILIEKAMADRDRALLYQPVEDSEFFYAASLLSSADSDEDMKSLNVGEFMLFQLIRLGLTNGNQLDQFRKDFNRLDKAGRGKIDLEVFEANNLAKSVNKINKYKKQHIFSKITNSISLSKKHSELKSVAPPKRVKKLTATKEEALRRAKETGRSSDNLVSPRADSFKLDINSNEWVEYNSNKPDAEESCMNGLLGSNMETELDANAEV